MNYEYEATEGICAAKNMMATLEYMNELLSIFLTEYMLDKPDDYTKDHEAISKFVAYVINKNLEYIDKPRVDTVPMLDLSHLNYKFPVDDSCTESIYLQEAKVWETSKDFATVSCGQEEVPCSNVRVL